MRRNQLSPATLRRLHLEDLGEYVGDTIDVTNLALCDRMPADLRKQIVETLESLRRTRGAIRQHLEVICGIDGLNRLLAQKRHELCIVPREDSPR
jgi:hypothetical protein